MDQFNRAQSQADLEQLEKEGKLISDALRITIDTENVSNETSRILVGQTEQLEGINLRLHEFNETVGKARSHISAMFRRLTTDRMIWCGIATVILLAIIISVYFIVDSQIKKTTQ